MSPESITVTILDPHATAAAPLPGESLIDSADPDSPENSADGHPDASLLEDRFPERWRAPRVLAVMMFAIGLVFWFFSNRPLWHTDVWGHLAYGQLILETGELPRTEPLMPLSKGVPFIDSAWLTQVVGALIHRNFGNAGLQASYAFLIAASSGLLLWRMWTRTGRMGVGLCGLIFLLGLNWVPLIAIRPQLVGMILFSLVLFRVTRTTLSKADLVVFPLIFAVWANSHGSFFMGIGLLGCVFLGRTWDVFSRTGQFNSLITDRRWRHWLAVAELSAVATLLNPYGWRLHAETWQVAGNPNLADLTEWRAWDVHSFGGNWFVAAIIVLFVVYRHSPRKVAGWEGLALSGFGIAALRSERMMLWWSLIAAYLLVLHGSTSWNRWMNSEPAASPRAGLWTIMTIGLLWISLAVSPLARQLMHKSRLDETKSVSRNTPVAAVEWLRENPPVGQVFNTYEWGDYLHFRGPENVQVFVNSHAHLVPREVWQHYMQVIQQHSGWEDLLDRYGVNTILLDAEERTPLIKKLKDDAKWKVGYEDNLATVFVRKKPI